MAGLGPEPELAAGDFSGWLAAIKAALGGGRGTDVPCGGCTACCASYQFVDISPDEQDTLACIPAALLAPAPGRPGHVVLGYDEHGRCPMLVEDGCSIYDHRPRTCRTYDCRVLPAAGVEVSDDHRALIGRQARRWRFGFATQADRDRHAAVKAAAAFLGGHPDLLPDRVAPADETQLAVLAIAVHDAFLRHDEATGRTTVVDPDPATVRVEVMRRFEDHPAPRP